MERRNSYSRHVNATTAAARVANVQNKRETLLLEKTSKGLSCQTDGTLRSFFREKAKANDFLQKVHGKNLGMLKPAKMTIDEHRLAAVDNKIGLMTANEARDAIKAQRTRRTSLDVSQIEETRKRMQEFLTRELPGQDRRSGSVEQKGQLNGVSGENGLNSGPTLNPNISADVGKTNAASATPFKVRSRASGVCSSHSHCRLQPLPSVNVPNKARKFPEAEFRINSSRSGFKNGQFPRKLSTPIMVGQMSLERKNLYDVNTSSGSRDKPHRDETAVIRRNSTPAPRKKYSI